MLNFFLILAPPSHSLNFFRNSKFSLVFSINCLSSFSNKNSDFKISEIVGLSAGFDAIIFLIRLFRLGEKIGRESSILEELKRSWSHSSPFKGRDSPFNDLK